MDISKAIQAYPWVGIPFMLCAVFSACLLFAFVMQWNHADVARKSWGRIWEESKGMRFIVPLAFVLGGIAWLLFELLERLVAQ